MAKAFSEMTDAEKRAWASEQTAPKAKTPTVASKPAYTPKTAEDQAKEAASRKGGYLRDNAWFQTTDGHQ